MAEKKEKQYVSDNTQLIWENNNKAPGYEVSSSHGFMQLPNIYGYGQLFGFSGIEGKNNFENDFVGTLMHERIGVRFELNPWIKFDFPYENATVKFETVLGDIILAKTDDIEFSMIFVEGDTVIGESAILPNVTSKGKLSEVEERNGLKIYTSERKGNIQRIALAYKNLNNIYRYCIRYMRDGDDALADIDSWLECNIELQKQNKLMYMATMPKCKRPEYEQLYYKCLSVQKVNVHTPEGNINCMWTTPDRVPHRSMWLWDSVFHSMAISEYNEELAKDCIRGILLQIQPDGMVPHMMSPLRHSEVTQPQVISWGAWQLYEKTKDRAFLEFCLPYLERYLEFGRNMRDNNSNGLLEWKTDPLCTNCKCDESGLDNSPRFDFDEEMDAVDFSSFLANDAYYLALICNELGYEDKKAYWKEIYETTKSKINELLWDEEQGFYCDRLVGGELTHVLSASGFMPLLARIPDRTRVERMLEHLNNESEFGTPRAIPSVPRNHPVYSTDMWRGGVWVNINYIVAEGLEKCGFFNEAEILRDKTVAMVNKWYKKTGTVFEFYDPEDSIAPWNCERKGITPEIPDWRIRVHSISDYNWSACLTMKLIQR